MPALWEDWPYCHFLFADKGNWDLEKQRDYLQCHTASSGSEPKSPIPKPFSFHDLCSLCLLEVFPFCQSSDSLSTQGVVPGGSEALSVPVRPTWSGPSTPLWPPLPWPSASLPLLYIPASLLFNELLRDALTWRVFLQELPHLAPAWPLQLQDGEWTWVVKERRYFE